jgi:hypothetical protein
MLKLSRHHIFVRRHDEDVCFYPRKFLGQSSQLFKAQTAPRSDYDTFTFDPWLYHLTPPT